MTALRGLPDDFGYMPAREFERVSARARDRALLVSCLVMGALFGLSLVSRPWWPQPRVPAADLRRAFDLSGVSLVEPPETPPQASVAPARAQRPFAVPVPVPAEPSAPESTPEPVTTGSAGGVSGGVANAEGSVTGDLEPFAGVNPPDRLVPPPVDELPEAVLRVSPSYPSIAIDAGVEGTVLVWALVDVDGSVRDVRVARSVPMLDSAATDALRRWRFTPAVNQGRPVRVWVAIPVRFSLH